MLRRLETSKKWPSILNVVLIVALMAVPWRVASGVGLAHVLLIGHTASQLHKGGSVMHKSGGTIVSTIDGLKNSSPDYYQKLVDDGRNILAEYNTSDLNSSLTNAEITPEAGFAMQVYLHNLVDQNDSADDTIAKLKNSSPDHYQKLVDDGQHLLDEYITSDLNSLVTDAEIAPEDGFAMQVYLHNLVNDRKTEDGMSPVDIAAGIWVFGTAAACAFYYGGCMW